MPKVNYGLHTDKNCIGIKKSSESKKNFGVILGKKDNTVDKFCKSEKKFHKYLDGPKNKNCG